MASVFPTAKDSFGSVTDLSTDVIAEHINELRRAIEALEEKVGITNDSNTNSFDYRIDALENP